MDRKWRRSLSCVFRNDLEEILDVSVEKQWIWLLFTGWPVRSKHCSLTEVLRLCTALVWLAASMSWIQQNGTWDSTQTQLAWPRQLFGGSMSQHSGPYNALADLAICGGSSKREGTGRPWCANSWKSSLDNIGGRMSYQAGWLPAFPPLSFQAWIQIAW